MKQPGEEPLISDDIHRIDLPMNIKDVESMDPKHLMSKVLKLSQHNSDLEMENKELHKKVQEMQDENNYLIRNANEEITSITEAVD